MDPTVYHLDHHQIAADKIDQHAYQVIDKLKRAGYQAYLVGGGVRDLLLNVPPKDFDVSTSAKPEEIRALFRNAILIGRRFRLAHIRFGKKIIEVSTFRSGDMENSDLIVRDNEWGSEEQDVLRRDFTINGLFYDLANETVIDYVGGYADLEKRILRTIGHPEKRFSQDPVRMIRLIKFCARFNFDIERPTFEALLNCKGEILKSSSARVLEELLRMLESGSSKSFFHLLHQYGLLASLIPELAHFFERSTNHLTFKLLEEIDSEIKKNKEAALDRSLLLSALIFPLIDEYLKEITKREEKTLHLGQIHSAILHAIDCSFSHFFALPRKMRSIVAFILATQYRLIPLDGKTARRPRAPNDPLFPLALHLLKFRASVQPELLPQYTIWSEASFSSHEQQHPNEFIPSRPKRRRRR